MNAAVSGEARLQTPAAEAERDADVSVAPAGSTDAAKWNGFVESCQHAEIYHLYEWRHFFERVFGHECHYLVARDSTSTVRGVLPLVHIDSRLFGSYLVSVPCFNYCGVLADGAAASMALVAAAEKLAGDLKATHVELRHRDHVSLDLPHRDDKVSMRLPLPDSSDELWKGFSSKLRAQIRRPRKAGAVCTDGGVELLDDFYAVFARNMRDLGTPVYPKAFFAEIFACFPDAARFFVVRLDEKPVAGGIVLGFKETLEIPCASSLREYNRQSPNMLLYWSVLEYAISQGHRYFDFGRTTRNSGPHRFKKQWGAEEGQLVWHYVTQRGQALPQLNPDNPKYRLAVNAWRRLPVPIANLIGPRIIKHLP